jgi:hypothetical protein
LSEKTMTIKKSIGYGFFWATLSLLQSACGGGGYSGDTTPSTPPIAEATGLDRFLLFPNPQAVSIAAERPYQTESEAYARAYYDAIDPGPNPKKDTLEKWKLANKFDEPGGVTTTAVFGDKRDLGYGRRMTARYDSNTKTIAFLVENYVVNPGKSYGYSKLSLEAAAGQDTRWRIGINAIEFSPGPDGGASFAKFFNFNSQTGQRELMVDLDFRGPKAMPGPCITCHGGRADALQAGEKFPLTRNIASKTAGDVQAHLAPFEVDSLDFLDTPGFTRNDQEDELKLMNLMVLCTYPSKNKNESCAKLTDATRRQLTAAENEWEGASAAGLIEAAYTQNGVASGVYKEPPVPEDWVNAGQSNLYTEVVVPACRMCHMLRGTSGQAEIDFESYEKFKSYRDRIKAHVFDRGNMPLAKLVYDRFWDSSGPAVLATFLENQPEMFKVRDVATGVVLQPGRPIADPGPHRAILGPKPPLQPAKQRVTARLSAAGSLFATSYNWTLLTNPDGAGSLVDVTSAAPTFEATKDGIYVVQLAVSNAFESSQPVSLSIHVKSDLPQPEVVGFSNVLNELQNNPGEACTSCHKSGDPRTPVFYDSPSYEEIRSRVNFTEIVASPLLRKPAGEHHGAGAEPRLQFEILNLPPGDARRKNYDLFLNWILNGAPR